MTYLDYLEKKVLLERLVIGLEEPVLVKGLGELQAKIDSGNGGYNVIHGTDFHQQGDVLMFTTHDSFGHEKKISAKIIDDIEVNMGGGNIEKRPVIELDIKFAGEDYKKIPFSVSDRSSNTHPILISKGFVENELEALIDVGAKNISNDGVDVVYGESVSLDEGVLGAIGNGIGSAVNGVAKTAGDINKGLDTVGNFGRWLSGDVSADTWMPQFSFFRNSNNRNLVKQIKDATVIEENDKNTISSKQNNLTIGKKIAKDPKADLSNNIVQEWNENKLKITLPTCLVTSYMMCKGNAKDRITIKGLEKDKETLKNLISKFKEEVVQEKEKRNIQSEEQEETTNTDDSIASPTVEQPSDNSQNTKTNTTSEEEKDFEEVTTFVEELCSFTLWFVSIEKIKNVFNYEKEFKQFIQSGQFDSILYKMFKSGEISPQTIEPYVNKLAVEFQNKGKQGFFVLCWTPQSKTELKDEMKDIKRQTHFYEDLQNVSYAKSESNSKNFDKVEAEIENQLKGEESAVEEPTTQEVQTPAPQPQSEETKHEIVEEPSKTPKFDEAEKEVLKTQETEPTPQKQGKSQPQLKVKSRSQMNAHARANKKAHMNKGKKKGTESEEEPYEEDDPWISEKLNLLKQKGLI